MVSHPAGDIAGVLSDKLKLSSLNIASVHVKDFWIILVHVDEHVYRVVFEVIKNARLHLLKRCEVSCFAALDVGDVHVEILIASCILSVYYIFVALPEEASYVAFSC